MSTNKPKTLTRTLNTILISWTDSFPNTQGQLTYILEFKTPLTQEWKVVYWGQKLQASITNLAPCNFYSFRLRYYTESDTSDWLYFKSGTDSIPYFVIHFTRAVRFAKTSVIRKIIARRPILLDAENKEGKTPLIQATESGNFQMASFLINMGANVNKESLITKRTPLMIALFHCNLQIASLLIDRGANLTARDCNLLTGLHHAIDSGRIEAVEFCLNHNFELNVKDCIGWTPLIRAVVVLDCSDEILSLLLEKGADYTLKDRNGFDFIEHLKMNKRDHLKKLPFLFINKSNHN